MSSACFWYKSCHLSCGIENPNSDVQIVGFKYSCTHVSCDVGLCSIATEKEKKEGVRGHPCSQCLVNIDFNRREGNAKQAIAGGTTGETTQRTHRTGADDF